MFFQHCTSASDEDLVTGGTSNEEEDAFLSILLLVLLVVVVVLLGFVVEPVGEGVAAAEVNELQSTSNRHMQRTRDITTQLSASTR